MGTYHDRKGMWRRTYRYSIIHMCPHLHRLFGIQSHFLSSLGVYERSQSDESDSGVTKDEGGAVYQEEATVWISKEG